MNLRSTRRIRPRAMPKNKLSHIIPIIAGLVVGVVSFYGHRFLPGLSVSYVADVSARSIAIATSSSIVTPPKLIVTHVRTPEAVKAIYMTSWVGGAKDEDGKYYWRDSIMDLINETELNSLVVDIKDYSGKISFELTDPKLIAIGAGTNRIPDIREFIAELHDKGIYVIGRLSVFQDPHMVSLRPDLAVKRADNGAVWKDYKGISWIDIGATEYWDYISRIALESYSVWFDEINFDYIRFPSDGDMENIAYDHHASTTAKSVELERFFSYLARVVGSEGIPISADLFGMVTVSEPGFDLNIGQVFEGALPYFDFIAPMVYPSHYPNGFHGYKNPNDVPYEIVKYSMDEAVKKINLVGGDIHKLRPWLQDFDYGGDYDVADVRAQKQAVYDSGLTSWMIWDPGVKYTRGALDSI